MSRRDVLKRLSAHEIGVSEAERLLTSEGQPDMPIPAAPPARRGGRGCGCAVAMALGILLLALMLLAAMFFRVRATRRVHHTMSAERY